MFNTLQEFIPQFPLQQDHIQQKQFILIKDTLNCDGNFIISNLLHFLLKKQEKVTFLAAQQNYAHYLTISKKTACSLEQYILSKSLHYIDLQSEINDWIPQDLPYTEKTPQSFIQPPNFVEKITKKQDEKAFFQQLLDSVNEQVKQGFKHVILDSLTGLYNGLENSGLVFQFFQELYRVTIENEVNVYLMVTCLNDVKLLKYIGLIEQQACVCLEFFENPSGYQQDIAGQLIVKFKGDQSFKFLVSLTENIAKISREYKA